MMTTADFYNYTLEKVNKSFNNPELLKGEIRGDNGVFILEFKMGAYLLSLVSDRGLFELYLFLDGKSLFSLLKYPQLFNLPTTKDNIDFIVDFLWENRDQIFP